MPYPEIPVEKLKIKNKFEMCANQFLIHQFSIFQFRNIWVNPSRATFLMRQALFSSSEPRPSALFKSSLLSFFRLFTSAVSRTHPWCSSLYAVPAVLNFPNLLRVRFPCENSINLPKFQFIISTEVAFFFASPASEVTRNCSREGERSARNLVSWTWMYDATVKHSPPNVQYPY